MKIHISKLPTEVASHLKDVIALRNLSVSQLKALAVGQLVFDENHIPHYVTTDICISSTMNLNASSPRDKLGHGEHDSNIMLAIKYSAIVVNHG